jgi:hypothetical protein
MVAQKWEHAVIVNPIGIFISIVIVVPVVTVIPWPCLCWVGHPFDSAISG